LPASELTTDEYTVKNLLEKLPAALQTPPIFLLINVKMDKIYLTLSVKMGYYMTMLRDFISFILRISLIVALWVFVWKLLEPRTQLMRILRAAVLLFGLLGVLALLRMTGR